MAAQPSAVINVLLDAKIHRFLFKIPAGSIPAVRVKVEKEDGFN
jgi:hypothetical protein